MSFKTWPARSLSLLYEDPAFQIYIYFLLTSTPCALYSTAASGSELFQIGLL